MKKKTHLRHPAFLLALFCSMVIFLGTSQAVYAETAKSETAYLSSAAAEEVQPEVTGTEVTGTEPDRVETAPENAAKEDTEENEEDTSPGTVTSEETSEEGASTEESTLKETSEESASTEAATPEETSEEGTSTEAFTPKETSEEGASTEAATPEETLQEGASSEVVTSEETSEEGTSMEESTLGESSEESASTEAATSGETPQEGASPESVTPEETTEEGFLAENAGIPLVNNGIPVVYFNIDESRGTIADLFESEDHSANCYGTVSIDVPEGFRYSDFPDLDLSSVINLAMSIHGRGNSTWQLADKKPFKLKLDKKADIFGLGKNKHWVLLANSFDDSLIQDRLTGWLGDQMGFSFTPRGVPVDLVMTGSNYGSRYLGSYYFSENVRVDKNRLEIAELEEDDTDPQIITGGYLLQNGSQLRDDSPDRFYTSREIEWGTNTPSFDPEDGYVNPDQQQYIQNHIQKIEDVLWQGDTAYRELIDVESAAKFWLVNEISKNQDAYATGSTYIYKDRDTAEGESKLFWGPIWDFDFAWSNNEETDGFSAGFSWMLPMLYDREDGGFVQELHRQWPGMKAALIELVKDGGVIDRYYEETKASAEQNHLIWTPDTDFDYRAEIEALKTWIMNRTTWADEHFDMIDNLVHKVTFIADGVVIAYDFKRDGEFFYENIYEDENGPSIVKDGYTFLGWADEEGRIIDSSVSAERDYTLTAVYVKDSETTPAEDNPELQPGTGSEPKSGSEPVSDPKPESDSESGTESGSEPEPGPEPESEPAGSVTHTALPSSHAPLTGDDNGSEILFWAVLFAASSVTFVLLLKKSSR